ncbi:MAG: helix-turn-helix domain-containing protein [Propionibacteriales bacterium]|nr:helix-turn-helix domain-containing protein [Propionibacteriales bacterium]
MDVDLSPGYRELTPPPVLRGVLECVWVRVTAPGGPSTSVLPDACSDLIWQSGRGAFVAGPDTEPIPFTATPGEVLIGARFVPGAGGPALGVPLGAVRNQRVDAADVRPDIDRRLPGTLTPQEALRRLARTAGRLAASDPPDRSVRAAARMLADPRVRVETLADRVGLSERQLRRRFHDGVGYGPKTLQRVLRFRRFLAHLDAGGPPAGLADLAQIAGYADQSHLTRECAHLAGTTPAALARGRYTTTVA